MPVSAHSTRQTGAWRFSSSVCLPRGKHLGLLALLIALLASLAGCGASLLRAPQRLLQRLAPRQIPPVSPVRIASIWLPV